MKILLIEDHPLKQAQITKFVLEKFSGSQIETKNSWGKNQLNEIIIKTYKDVSTTDKELKELIVFSNYIAVISEKYSWGKNEAKFALLDLLAQHI